MVYLFGKYSQMKQYSIGTNPVILQSCNPVKNVPLVQETS